jgi:hypothetical protein
MIQPRKTVVDLNRHVPNELRELGKAAYRARRKLQAAQQANAAAMLAFTACCNKFGIRPDSLQIGEVTGAAIASVTQLDRRLGGAR